MYQTVQLSVFVNELVLLMETDVIGGTPWLPASPHAFFPPGADEIQRFLDVVGGEVEQRGLAVFRTNLDEEEPWVLSKQDPDHLLPNSKVSYQQDFGTSTPNRSLRNLDPIFSLRKCYCGSCCWHCDLGNRKWTTSQCNCFQD